MDINKKDGNYLREYLVRKGMTSKYVAGRLNISTAAFSKYLNSQQFRPDTLESLLKALEITKDQLFGIQEPNKEEYVPKQLYEEQQLKINMLNEQLMAYIAKENMELKAERKGVTP